MPKTSLPFRPLQSPPVTSPSTTPSYILKINQWVHFILILAPRTQAMHLGWLLRQCRTCHRQRDRGPVVDDEYDDIAFTSKMVFPCRSTWRDVYNDDVPSSDHEPCKPHRSHGYDFASDAYRRAVLCISDALMNRPRVA